MHTPKKPSLPPIQNVNEIGPSRSTVQAVCGGLFGFLLGFSMLFRHLMREGNTFGWENGLIFLGLVPAIVAFLAWKFGDRFWYALRPRPRRFGVGSRRLNKKGFWETNLD